MSPKPGPGRTATAAQARGSVANRPAATRRERIRSRPRIIHRYFLREVLSPTLLALALYTFLLLMNEFFLLAEHAQRYALPLSSLWKLLALQVPHIIVLTLPMSLLVGILVATARLAADSELVALSAGGVSLGTLLHPVLVLATVFTLLTGWLAFDLMPRANSKISRTLFEIFQENVLKGVRPGEFNSRLLPGFTLYVQEVRREPDGERWLGVLFSASSQGARGSEVIFAREARPIVDREAAAVVIQLSDATVQTAIPNGIGYDVRAFDQLSKAIQTPSIRRRVDEGFSKGVRDSSLTELVARLDLDGTRSEFMHRMLHIEIHKRFAIPATCLVFAFLGLGLGAGAKKSARSFAFVMSLVVFVAYQQLFFTGERLGASGVIAPWVSMWSGNLLFGGIGVLLFLQRASEGGWLSRLRARVRWRGPRLRLRRIIDRPRAWWRLRQHTPRLGRTWHLLGFLRLADRYVLGRYLAVLALVVSSSLVIYINVTLLQLLDDISRNHIPISTVLDLYVAWMPEILTYVMPVSVLVSTIVCFSLLTRTNEVTAMLVNGISRYRLVLPVVLTGVVLTAAGLPLYASWLPRSSERYDELYGRVAGKAPRPNVASIGWVAHPSGSRFYNFAGYEPEKGVFGKLSYFELDAKSFAPLRHVFALQATWDGTLLRLERGWSRSFVAGSQTAYRAFESSELPFAESRRDFGREWRDPKFMTADDLYDYIVYRRAHGLQARELEVELESKRALPFVGLVMMLLGLPFAFAIGKRGSLYGIGIAIILAALFWSAVVVCSYLGKLGVLPPALAAWSPHLVFALWGITGFLSLRT